jgi:hypothetical protein
MIFKNEFPEISDESEEFYNENGEGVNEGPHHKKNAIQMS